MQYQKIFFFVAISFYSITNFLLLLFCKVYHRADWVGFKDVPLKGPFIIVANHESFIDPWFIAALLLPRHVRYLVTTKWYYKNKLWKLLFDLNSCIPVNPFKMEHSTIKAVMKVLKKGGIVGIFPEGRVCYDGKLQEFNPGAIYVAMKANVPILPIAICGTYQALPRQNLIPKPKKMRIVIGKPLHFAKSLDENKNSKDKYSNEMQKIKDWIAGQIEQFNNQWGVH